MTEYRRVLLVVDLTEDSLPIGRRAQAVATAMGAEVDLLHVVEYVPVEPMGKHSCRLFRSRTSYSIGPNNAS